MNQIIEKIKLFNVVDDVVNLKQLSGGHINTTYLVTTAQENQTNKYVLQKINKYVFKNPDEVMQNIVSITNFIKDKIFSKGQNYKRKVLNFLQSTNGLPYIIDENGDYWRMYEFIDQSVCYDNTSDLKIIEETGKAFGEFQLHLDDYPIEELYITIKNFHNLPMRYDYFDQVIKIDRFDRANKVSREIESFFNLENYVSQLNLMLENGKLPYRVTHNDTKCNNVLFDKNTNKKLCVIDLDTVMPGLVAFDYGDAIRCIANTAKEDEKDLSKVKLDLNRFKAFTKGFLSLVGDKLTDKEKETLYLGPISIATELALRFLTDYLEGDVYFKTDYLEHNLDRARCQLELAKDMLLKKEKMKEIIDECLRENQRNLI